MTKLSQVDSSSKPHVFISYAHKDTPFVKNIVEGLEHRNVTVWVDWSGILPTASWWNEIQKAIDGCSAFIFFISSHSILSEVCLKEIVYADSMGKRMIPVLMNDVGSSKIPAQISTYQWIDITGLEDQESIVSKLVEAIELDLAWNEKHARLLLRIREWEENNSETSRLLRGKELEEAELWMDKANPQSGRIVSPGQRSFIETSRKKTASRLLPIFYAALFLCIGMFFIFHFIDQPLRTPASPNGIVSFELAQSIDEVDAIRDSWKDSLGQGAINYGVLSLGLDFLFIFLYCGTMISICLYFARALKRRLNIISRLSIIAAILVGMAGVFDIIENIALINLLFGSNNLILPKIAFWSSTTKLGLLTISFLFTILVPILLLWAGKKKAVMREKSFLRQ